MPGKKSEQVQWAATLVSVVGPAESGYGVPTGIMAPFTAANTTLQTAWTTSQEPATRTRGTVAAADNALDAMKIAARPVVAYIQANPAVTDQMKIDAGVTVRKTTPSPKPAPVAEPRVVVSSVNGRNATIELWRDVRKRGKAANATGAMIFTCESETVPLNSSDWQFALSTTKTIETLSFGPSATGTKVWITASWANAKFETGPGATPVSVDLPAGGVLPQSGEASNDAKSSMRRAA